MLQHKWPIWLHWAHRYSQHGVLQTERPIAEPVYKAQGASNCAGARSWAEARGWGSAESSTFWGTLGRSVQPKSGRLQKTEETEKTPNAQCQTWPRVSRSFWSRENSRNRRSNVCIWWTVVFIGVGGLQKNKLEIQLKENFLEDLHSSRVKTTFLTWFRCESHPLPESQDSPMTTNSSKTGPGLKESTQS